MRQAQLLMFRRAITAEAFEAIPQARSRTRCGHCGTGAGERSRQYAPAVMRATVTRERRYAWRYCGPHAVSQNPL